MIKPTPKEQDGKLYAKLPEEGSLVLMRRKGKVHVCFLKNNRLVKIVTDEEKSTPEGMICIAKVGDIVKNIHAAFLRIDNQQKCFIPLDDLEKGDNLSRPGKPFAQGDNVLIQISKAPSKGKEASATTQIRLAGSNCAVMLGETGVFYSKKMTAERRAELKHELESIEFSGFKDAQVIVRTEARNADAIKEEANIFYEELKSYIKTAACRTDFSVLKTVYTNFQRAILKYGNFCEKILTEDAQLYEDTKAFFMSECPKLCDKLHLYEDKLVSLNVLYGLERKLEEAINTKVWLKNGGFLYIEPTQAMTVIDVNSGKYDKKTNNEDTYLAVNLEAAEEIAHQIFLRNLSGIIVVDFINMKEKENREKLILKLEELLNSDDNPGHVFGFTRLGLVEITRKKTDKTIYEQILV